MANTRFRSNYGAYDVIRCELARQPETNSDGVTTQAVLTFETAEAFSGDQQPVRITGATLFVHENGHRHSASYSGQQRTLSRDKARQQYRSALAQGYSPDIARI